MSCEHHWHDEGIWEFCCECNAHKCEAIDRVRKLHKPITSYKGVDHIKIVGCIECEETGSGREYFVEYPCPTIKALDGEQ